MPPAKRRSSSTTVRPIVTALDRKPVIGCGYGASVTKKAPASRPPTIALCSRAIASMSVAMSSSPSDQEPATAVRKIMSPSFACRSRSAPRTNTARDGSAIAKSSPSRVSPVATIQPAGGAIRNRAGPSQFDSPGQTRGSKSAAIRTAASDPKLDTSACCPGS
jgi:hypothetical protein